MNLQNSGTARSVKIGCAALVTVWICGMCTVPIVKVLAGTFSAEEILFFRSVAGSVFSFMLVGGRVWKTDWRVKLAGPIVGFSSIGFYRAIQIWDIAPVMVILTLLPAINMLIAVVEGRPVSAAAPAVLALLVVGIYIALDPLKKPINHAGLCWVLTCALAAAIGLELWGKSPERTTISEKCFWLSLPIVIAAPVVIRLSQWPIDFGKYAASRPVALLAVFGLVNGILYTYCTIIPFSRAGKMSTVAAAVLLQGTTPFTIVGGWLFIGDKLGSRQWFGVFVALGGAILLSYILAKKPKQGEAAALPTA